MQRRMTSVLGALVLVTGLGCAVEEDGRFEDEGIERGVWQEGDKSDATATCAQACGDQAVAGCWCDDQCEDYGDCCPDKAAVCDDEAAADGGAADGGSPMPPPATGEPGAVIGSFQLTYYWITDEGSFAGADTTRLFDESCHELTKVPAGFASAIKLEGTGRLTDGRVLNYEGSCGCPTSPCYFEVDADHPWGVGVQNRALVPFRSIAVDKSVIAYGSKVYIEALDGVTMPGEAPWGGFVHDGCVSADDTGSAIIGKHIDFFSARKADYLSLNAVLGVSNVTVRAGGERCSGA
jgi:3D (Asp-Asp-Asp) domain-containing protein